LKKKKRGKKKKKGGCTKTKITQGKSPSKKLRHHQRKQNKRGKGTPGNR